MNALRFNVAGLLKESAGATRDLDVRVSPQSLAGLIEGGRPIADLRGHAHLMRTQRSIFVRGRLATEVEVECSRCLVATPVPIAFDLEAEYFPEIDIATGHPLPAPDDDLAFTIDANHELDLREAVRQLMLLELPMQSLCEEACRGLCPRCGANLNADPCRCPPDDVDERLTPLRALLSGLRTED
jgi:uncharacterized protein